MQRLSEAIGARAIRRGLVPFSVMGVCLWGLGRTVDLSSVSALPGTLDDLPPGLFALAAALCALSFWAVARYDSLAHRHFDTGVSDKVARRSGFAAIAIAQTAGFGILTGAAVRWRMMPDIGFATALKLSGFVSVTFMLALGFLVALACILLDGPGWTVLPAFIVSIALPFAALLVSFAPAGAALRHRLTLPSLRACFAILCWATLDVLAAAAALYLLIPAADLSFAVFLPVFLLALGAAVLSGAPGGVGPFELMLVSLLPQVPTVDLVAGIVAFRALYYAIPALMGAALTLSPPREAVSARSTDPVHRLSAANPELAVLSQNGGRYVSHPGGSFAFWSTTQTATLLFDPVEGSPDDALRHLCAKAHRSNKLPALYKCGPRTAVAARRLGWTVARVAEDCEVDAARFDSTLPAFRGLRRKLRKARAARVTVTRATSLPIADLADIDAAWQAQHGAARGGSMGRFCPDYLSRQDVYIAWRDSCPMAFVSFNRGTDRWCLDLMRHGTTLPDGTMHLLVTTAIEDAARAGVRRVSLAALPCPPPTLATLPCLKRYFEASGMRQFKNSFAPKRRARYAATPGPVSLGIALADIASEIHFPRPLPSCSDPHNQDEDYELASNTSL